MTPFRLGLTGSIGMGKTTTATMFADEGLPVWDADAAVHRLYAPGGAAVAPIAALCPKAATPAGIDRAALKDWIAADPSALAQLESIVHPIVAADRDAFITNATADIVVLDIPLLFEKGTEAQMDATLLCTAPAALQFARVMARGTMTKGQLETFLARQMPDADKRARATHIVETLSLDSTRAYVRALIAHIREARHNA
jgi:dephospho-CoA kinase